MYCCVVGDAVVPIGIEVLPGEILRFVVLAAMTVKFEVAPGVPAAMAVIVVVPGATAVAG